ncbi:response regulator transcription factor [Tichowtungia aerotolerans]|uniref:Response regulator n=1 Tax=Tichowtungia aerotolerans TaxID=2697043 RepID=A0A6P1M904_9BACT|nr:response regulator transcription factor [Tichowtungia aerotolerans]QHI70371.1 response regulator [Tichowtungia aerotolerans]
MNILVVEDNLEMSRSIADLLGMEGHTVFEAHTFQEALANVKHSIMLVLLDVMLPDGRGEHLIGQLKSEGRNPHVIMLTALSDMASKRLCYEAGADDYITKPFELMELLFKVNAIQQRETSNSFLKIGALKIDRVSGEMHYGKKYVVLPPSQFRLLDALYRKYLLSESLNPEEIGAHESRMGVDVRRRVRSLVTRTRNSIREVGCESVNIRSNYGEGYSLEIRG